MASTFAHSRAPGVGIANHSLGALVSADWTYIGDGNAADLDEYRDRFRALAHAVLQFALASDVTRFDGSDGQRTDVFVRLVARASR